MFVTYKALTLPINKLGNYGKVKYIVDKPYIYMAYPEPLIILRIHELNNVLKDDPMDDIYPYPDYEDTREYRKLIIRY